MSARATQSVQHGGRFSGAAAVFPPDRDFIHLVAFSLTTKTIIQKLG